MTRESGRAGVGLQAEEQAEMGERLGRRGALPPPVSPFPSQAEPPDRQRQPCSLDLLQPGGGRM